MTQQNPSFNTMVAKDELIGCLGLEKSDFIERMVLQIISRCFFSYGAGQRNGYFEGRTN